MDINNMHAAGGANVPWDYETFKSTKPNKYPEITPDLHEKIRRLYQEKQDCSGEVKAFSERHGLPRWKVSRYAVRNGFIPVKKKDQNWTDAELHVLELQAHNCPEVIQRKLKEKGFKRTLAAIALKRRRMRFSRNVRGDSARGVAVCLGVDEHFVTRAIRDGKLRADRRKDKRVREQGGSTWFIKPEWVRKYIVENINEIDIRKVDKYWFVDLLAG